jgi:hypothetical protein
MLEEVFFLCVICVLHTALQISKLLLNFCSRAGWRFLLVCLGDTVIPDAYLDI